MAGLIGKKLGMSNVFIANGNRIPVTILEVGPCKVMRIRTKEIDGYSALQIGYGSKKEAKVNKPEAGYLKKHNLTPVRVLRELDFGTTTETYTVGQEITVELFTVGEKVKVVGQSKGKGFQGVMRRHNFGGVGGTTHGQSDRLRAPGSIGSSSYPSRVFKGQRMAGRMGNERVTVLNLEVIQIDTEKNLIKVKGAVPGAVNSIIELHKK